MPRRSRAREIVLQLLYEDDLNPTRNLAEGDAFLVRRLLGHPELVPFGRDLLSGVRRNRVEVDKAISLGAENWTVARMAATDRNVLRLGVFELFYTQTPYPVVINEAIDLARRYGSKHSAHFVNGVLDRVRQSAKKQDTTA